MTAYVLVAFPALIRRATWIPPQGIHVHHDIPPRVCCKDRLRGRPIPRVCRRGTPFPTKDSDDVAARRSAARSSRVMHSARPVRRTERPRGSSHHDLRSKAVGWDVREFLKQHGDLDATLQDARGGSRCHQPTATSVGPPSTRPLTRHRTFTTGHTCFVALNGSRFLCAMNGVADASRQLP